MKKLVVSCKKTPYRRAVRRKLPPLKAVLNQGHLGGARWKEIIVTVSASPRRRISRLLHGRVRLIIRWLPPTSAGVMRGSEPDDRGAIRQFLP